MKKVLKIGAMALGGLAASGLLLFAAASAKATSRLSQKFEAHSVDLPMPAASDEAAIERGRHLAEARYGCSSCHGKNLAGGVMVDEPPIGRILGPNLTPGRGSRTTAYSMADWDRLVRHGIKPDGLPAVMPSEDFFKMSDAELSDIVAYVRSVRAVDAEVAPPSFGPVGKVLLALGKFPLSAEKQAEAPHEHPKAPPATADSAQFGEHLAATCTACHRQNLAGGPMNFGAPDWPAAANLTMHDSGLGSWSFDDFERALTQGVSKDGHKLREPMAGVVMGTKGMLPTERKALWTYLRSVKPAATNP